MSPKRAADAKDATECMLQIGKYNNVVAWNLEMRASVGAVYGNGASFLTTNVRYVPRLPREEDYLIVYPVAEGDPPALAMPAALIADLKKDVFTGRKREIRQQKLDEKKIWSIMWMRMSSASQSKVKEEEGYEAANIEKDCVILWELIRRTHLTHIFGAEDPMIWLNKREQSARYSALKQGDREYISSFKTRYDAQIQSNRGAGVADMDEETQAMDFIHKLDPKRYERMLVSMRNNALRGAPDAYPVTLASALRIASGWVNEGSSSVRTPPGGSDNHAAFVIADTNLVTKSRDPTRKTSATTTTSTTDGNKTVKKKQLADVECYVCGELGHYSRDCKDRKVVDKALLTKTAGLPPAEDDYDYEDERDVAYVMTSETVLFSRDDVLLDSQASVNVFCNQKLLRNVRRSDKDVILNGVQSGVDGVKINQEGDFEDVGKVYYSNKSTANILSYAVMVDQGNSVRYDEVNDRFELRPVNSNKVYSFCRKNVMGSEGRFYCCNVNSMVRSFATTYPTTEEHAMIETEQENITRYTKREVEGARKARHLLARMGFPPVDQAMELATRGLNFSVTATDFRIANDIWGPDIAS